MGRGRTLAEFQKEFPDEARCAAFLSARRRLDGFVCPGCSRGRAVALKSRPRLLECLDCGRQTSLTAGTAMHRSKLLLCGMESASGRHPILSQLELLEDAGPLLSCRLPRASDREDITVETAHSRVAG